MTSILAKRCEDVLVELGLCRKEDITSIKPLTGGVASDIVAVTFGTKTVCVKFALEKLKVAADWFAPVHRNKAEYSWLSIAAETVPSAIPKLYGWSESENGFAMEYIAGPDAYLWKTNLLSGHSESFEAISVANTIGRIHAASTKPEFDRSAFENMDDFEQLRIDPYLRSTAKVHHELSTRLTYLADNLYSTDKALIHGDVSPKNILMRDGEPIILDAECATMGDPAFDVAFCMNHLILKSIHIPEISGTLLQATSEFWSAYKPHITWENPKVLEARVAALLPALMLARIDGKSPVEYLSENSREAVRQRAIPLILNPVKTVNECLQSITQGVNA